MGSGGWEFLRMAWAAEELRAVSPKMTVTPIDPDERQFYKLIAEAMATKPAEAEAALYRAYDQDRLLLYVGITDDLQQRQWGHATTSTWCRFAAKLDVQWWLAPEGLRAAERDAINRERPLWNLRHNDTHDARLRLVKYLIAKDHLDLLAPILSKPSGSKRPTTWTT